MKNLIVGVVAIGLIAVGLFVASLYATGEELEISSSGSNTFSLNVPMAKVRKILVRTDAGKRLIALSDAEFVSQDWSKLDLEADRPLLKRDWDVEGQGILIVKTTDPMVGVHELKLNQDLQIEPERLEIKTVLSEPTGPIRDYRSSLKVVPNSNENAEIESTLNLTYRQKVNWLTKSYAESRIRAAADSSLARQEEGLRAVIGEQADKLLILPNLGKD